MIQTYPLYNYLPCSLNFSDANQQLIKDIAIASLQELTISLAITGVTCLFVASAAIPTLLVTTAATVALNIFLRCYKGFCLSKIQELKAAQAFWTNQQANEFKLWNLQLKVLQFATAFTFSKFNGETTNTLIHEAGHALAALSVYKNAAPIIEIFPSKGGRTSFNPTGLSPLGKFLGARRAYLGVVVAGPLLGIVNATMQIASAHFLKKEHPELSQYLLASGLYTLCDHTLYALSALTLNSHKAGHDFSTLWKLGHIHPLVSAVAMVALPAIVKIGLVLADQNS